MAESTLSRLRALRDSTAEQLTFALRLVEKERNPETVIEALTVIERAAEDRTRPVLFARYEALDREGARNDPGGAIRVALLRALRSVARPDDAPLFARATTTYEHRFGEVAGDLRAAGLLALSEVDPTLAGFYAVCLLHDPHTSPMSGEPAATAARVLADLGQPLPLYACVIRDAGVPSEVVGECLRGLREIPASLVPGLVARYRDSEDEVVLLGLYDLLLEHPARAEFAPIVRDFLRSTILLDLYHSLVATIIAGRDPEWLAELRRMADEEKHKGKTAILQQVLPPR